MSLLDLTIAYSPFAVSVDRLNGDIGYHPGNVVLTTRFANVGRGAYKGVDFEERMINLLDNMDKTFNKELIDEKIDRIKSNKTISLY